MQKFDVFSVSHLVFIVSPYRRIFSPIEQILPKDDRRSKLVEYFKNTYFDRNGQFRQFLYLQWDYSSHQTFFISNTICWRNVVFRRYGVTKMNKVKPKTLRRPAEISKNSRAISHMSIDDQITNFTELLTCLGNANTSEFVLDRIPKDFLYLNDIFQ